jgi:hypothetical protein
MSVIHSKYTMTPIKSTDIPLSNIPVISDNCRISDSRKLKDFKDQTFGGYNVSKASAALDKAIIEDKLEPALHWSLQLYLSGIINSLWSKLITFAFKNINIYNPKLPEFIYNKNEQWRAIIDNPKFSKDNVLLLRNHPTVRLLLAELVTVLVLSKKKKINQMPTIKKNEFIIDIFKSKLEAKDTRLVDNIIIDGDPSEIRIAINEMAYHIYSKHTNKALYWLNWIIEWEKINSKKYGKYECANRPIEGIDSKYYKDVVWFIWATIEKMRQLKSVVGISVSECDRQIQYLWKLYLQKFTPAARSKKMNCIILSIIYLTELVDYNIPLVDRPQMLFQSLLGFDKIISTLKSQQVNNIANSDLVNIVVENNYMIPEHHKDMESSLKQKQIDKLIEQKQHIARQKKINVESLDKLTEISKLDKYLL